MAGKHLVVDGSNIATEGRTTPSLAQLDDAVGALRAEYGYARVNIVVDATFGHRIDAKERPRFEKAVNTGALITPPAGAIGRGDAFVLQIADKAGADVFSNDSFQEFHGQYAWLFDEGRLIGGKPVPGVGWVFVLRAPVRGPLSRKSVRAAKDNAKQTTKDAVKQPSKRSVPKKARDVPGQRVDDDEMEAALAAADVLAPRGSRPRRRRGGAVEPINEPLAYAGFVIDHPIGATVDGEVERFSSHGAYVAVGAARAYVPLKAMGDPPPRKAREVMKVGETRSFVVERFDPERRGIDLALASAASTQADSGVPAAEGVAMATRRSKQATAEEAHVSPAKKAVAKKTAARKAPVKKATAAKKAPARKAPAKRAPARKAAAKKAPARKAAAKKAPAKRSPARKAAAKRAPAKKATARKAPAKKATARKAPAKRAPARKAPAKKAPAKRAAKR